MFGNKMNIRKKAMDSMMREGPSIKIAFEKKMNGAEGEMGQEGQEGQEKEGHISLMVSPEEHEMIMQMRKEKGGNPEAEEMPQESEKQESDY